MNSFQNFSSYRDCQIITNSRDEGLSRRTGRHAFSGSYRVFKRSGCRDSWQGFPPQEFDTRGQADANALRSAQISVDDRARH